MAPIDRTMPSSTPDRVLVLSFASFASFLSSTSHLSAVSSAAQRSTHLLVEVRISTSDPSPWQPPAPSASSSSSSSTSTPPRPPAPAPTALWVPLERALARIYSQATAQFLAHDRILAVVDVVLEPMRGLPVCPPRGVEVERWEYASEGDEAGEQERIAHQAEGNRIYKVSAMGGTFDHLHAGHKILLTMACAITSHKLIVGVSDDALLKNKKFKEHLESLQYRMSAVEHFIELVRPSIAHQVVPLQDVYGPTANDPDINALVVSEETRAGGESINNLRASKQLSILDVWVINLVADDPTAPDDGAQPVKVETKMGSTGIREWISKRQAAAYCDSTGVSPLSPVPEETTPNPNLLSPATAFAPINFDSYSLSPPTLAASTFASTSTAAAIPFPAPAHDQRDEEREAQREALSTWEAWFFSEEQREDCDDWVERRRGSAPEPRTRERKVSVESLPHQPPLTRPTPFLRRPSTPYPPPVITSSSSSPSSSQPPSPTAAPSFVTAVWPGSRPGSRPGSVFTSSSRAGSTANTPESTPPVTPTSTNFPSSQKSTEGAPESTTQLKPPSNASIWSKLVGRRKSAPELYHRPRLSPSTTIGTTVTSTSGSTTASSARRPSVALLPPQPDLPGSRRPSFAGSLYPPSVPAVAPSTAAAKVLKKEKKEKECSAIRQLKKQQSKRELDEALEKAFERACSYGTRRPSVTKY
ncbi:hypothetical protein JCM1840_004571 [Sporobolomyces johnsonii]